MATDFGLGHIGFEYYAVGRGIPTDVWQGSYEVGQAAFLEEFPSKVDGSPRPVEEIGYALGGDDLASFMNHIMHPQLSMDEGRLRRQRVSRMTLAVARDEDAYEQPIVAMALSGDVVSGPDRLRDLKAAMLYPRWRWLQLIATHPNYQCRDIAHGLGAISYGLALPGAGASGYTWPEASKRAVSSGTKLLEGWRMPIDKDQVAAIATGSLDNSPVDRVTPFRAGEKILQVRQANPSAHDVVAAIIGSSHDPDRMQHLAHVVHSVRALRSSPLLMN